MTYDTCAYFKGAAQTGSYAVPKLKVTKLFQATKKQAQICELHYSNSEGKLSSGYEYILIRLELSFFQFKEHRKESESVGFGQ